MRRKHTNPSGLIVKPKKVPSTSKSVEDAVNNPPDWLLLTQSASNGILSSVERLLNSGCNVDLEADDGSTALHCAARTGQIEVLRVLISRGADVNAKNRGGRVPFLESFIGEHLDCMLLLLEAGTDMTGLWSDYGNDAKSQDHLIRISNFGLVHAILEATSKNLRRVVFSHLVVAFARAGHIAMLQHLHRINGTSIDIAYRDTHRKSGLPKALHYAVQNGHSASVEYLLPLYGKSDLSYRLLKIAARKGLTSVCKILLADSPATKLGDALYVAAEFGRLPVIKALLNHNTAAMAQGKLDLGGPILAALWNNRLEILRHLFSYYTEIAQPAEVQCDGLSLLELVKYLVRSGLLKVDGRAYPYAKSGRDGTLLHLAVAHSDFELASYVVQHESFNSSILERNCWWDDSFLDHNVKTALDFAQFRGHTEIASLLIAHGATNHNIAPRDPPQTGQNPAQSPSPNSDRNHEMQDLSDSDTDTDIDIDS